ncbi:MAG: prevent-host-death family protein [Blastocatellia bacterium]|nr:MAG: prevent-host-death family protein [Blastocatellia bacterium]
MIELHPEVVNKNGNQFVLLPFEEYQALKEVLEDYKDLLDLRAAKASEENAETVDLKEIKDRFGS